MPTFVVFNTAPTTFATNQQFLDARAMSRAVNLSMNQELGKPQLPAALMANAMIDWHNKQSVPLRAHAETRSCEITRRVWSVTSFEFDDAAVAAQFKETFE